MATSRSKSRPILYWLTLAAIFAALAFGAASTAQATVSDSQALHEACAGSCLEPSPGVDSLSSPFGRTACVCRRYAPRLNHDLEGQSLVS